MNGLRPYGDTHMMKRPHYEVKVLDGRKIVVQGNFDDYYEAMEFLDEVEERYGDLYTVKFGELIPMSRREVREYGLR